MCDSGKTLQEKKLQERLSIWPWFTKEVNTTVAIHRTWDLEIDENSWHTVSTGHTIAIKLINPHCIYNTEQCNPLRSPSALWNVIFFPQNKGNYKDHGLSL